jgi:DNA mismatch endonuclease (patch repair protein)
MRLPPSGGSTELMYIFRLQPVKRHRRQVEITRSTSRRISALGSSSGFLFFGSPAATARNLGQVGLLMFATLTREGRSRHMGNIRSFGNISTEVAFATLLRKHRIAGWRRHAPMPGRPDFYFAKLRVAVFIDGCFWHSCPKHLRMPTENVEWWRSKLEANNARDRRIARQLRKRGIRVLRVWEHDLKGPHKDRVAKRVSHTLGKRWGSRSNSGGRRPT